MPFIHRKTISQLLLSFGVVAAVVTPAAIACTQPLGTGPEASHAATQSAPMAFDEGATIGNGHNSAWYEYNPSTGVFVRIYSWYDPASDTTPIQPDEIDVTDDPELGIGGGSASTTSTHTAGEESIACDRGTPLPSITVTGITYGRGSLVGFLWRAMMGFGGGLRTTIKPQWSEVTIDVSNADCRNDVDETQVCATVMHALSLRGQGAVRAPGVGQTFRFVYRDGQHQTWEGTGVTGLCVSIRQGCYRP